MNPFTIRSMPTVLLSAVALLVLPACSDKSQEPKTERAESATYKSGVPGGIVVETTTHTARIVSVFPGTREVVLDLPDGKREVVTCGPMVVNFDQLRPNDMVKLTVTEQVAVAMASESDRPDTDAGGDTVVALAPKGAQPGAVMANVKQVTATVTAIDVPHHTATLQFPDGSTHKISVRHDIDLSKRRVGEKVVIRTTDAVALKVEKPKPQ
jgi:hypothetical protein